MASKLIIKLGDVFGDLEILREIAQSRKLGGSSCRTFELKCKCGNICNKRLSELRHPKYSKHCGCKQRKSRAPSLRAVNNIVNQRFGSLVVQEVYPEIIKEERRIRANCKCLCDCGAIVIRQISDLKRQAKRNRYGLTFMNCRDLKRHLVGPTYPPTPKDYPNEAWDIVRDYQPRILSFFEKNLDMIYADIQDVRMTMLIRVAWIIVFRRRQGEIIDKHKEQSLILKYFRSAKYVVKSKYCRTIEQNNKMGLHMTDSIVALEQEVERLADIFWPKKPRRFIRH